MSASRTAVSADDIAAMHDTTDPDIVDDYVVLMERADRLRGELATASTIDPRPLVAAAAATAIAEHPTAAFYLRELTRSCPESVPAGEVLRLECWWDTDPDAGGRVVADVMSVEEAADITPDPCEARGSLQHRGFYDASDPSQPMAALYIALGEKAASS